MAILLKAVKMFFWGYYIDVLVKCFDTSVGMRLARGEGLTDGKVNKTSQKLYKCNIKFMKLQKEIDEAIAKKHNM